MTASANVLDGQTHYPPLPSDDLLREHACLVARGVRSLALAGTCDVSDMAQVRHRLLTLNSAGAIPFTIRAGRGGATYGYAKCSWIIDLLTWAWKAPRPQRDRIIGLLLGYDADAIREFEELNSTIPFGR